MRIPRRFYELLQLKHLASGFISAPYSELFENLKNFQCYRKSIYRLNPEFIIFLLTEIQKIKEKFIFGFESFPTSTKKEYVYIYGFCIKGYIFYFMGKARRRYIKQLKFYPIILQDTLNYFYIKPLTSKIRIKINEILNLLKNKKLIF